MVYTTKPPVGTQLDFSNPLNNGLAALWIFNEGTGNRVYDLSGNANNGTLINIASPPTTISGWNPGRLGPCISVDGINDYINVGQPPSLMFTGAMTVEAWINPRSVVEDYRIIAKQGISGSRSWNLVSPTKPYFQISSNGTDIFYVQCASSINVNEWTHLVAVYIPSVALRIYKNGILDGENTTSIPSSQYINNGMDINIGRRPDGLIEHQFPGSISKVSIWNRALSTQEIKQLYINPYDMFIDTRKWKCSGSPNYICSQETDGIYNTETECVNACKEPCTPPTCNFTIY